MRKTKSGNKHSFFIADNHALDKEILAESPQSGLELLALCFPFFLFPHGNDGINCPIMNQF